MTRKLSNFLHHIVNSTPAISVTIPGASPFDSKAAFLRDSMYLVITPFQQAAVTLSTIAGQTAHVVDDLTCTFFCGQLFLFATILSSLSSHRQYYYCITSRRTTLVSVFGVPMCPVPPAPPTDMRPGTTGLRVRLCNLSGVHRRFRFDVFFTAHRSNV
ncbi:hypothetical protein QTP88_012741 [Uroleucon formosanum]